MHTHSIEPWRHSHVFLGARHDRHERRTWFVVALTAAMMVAEIVGGTIFRLDGGGGRRLAHVDACRRACHRGAGLSLRQPPRARRALYLRHREGGRTGGLHQRGDPRHDRGGDRLRGGDAALRAGRHPFPRGNPAGGGGLGVNLASAWLLFDSDHHHDHAHGTAHDHDRRARPRRTIMRPRYQIPRGLRARARRRADLGAGDRRLWHAAWCSAGSGWTR